MRQGLGAGGAAHTGQADMRVDLPRTAQAAGARARAGAGAGAAADKQGETLQLRDVNSSQQAFEKATLRTDADQQPLHVTTREDASRNTHTAVWMAFAIIATLIISMW